MSLSKSIFSVKNLKTSVFFKVLLVQYAGEQNLDLAIQNSFTILLLKLPNSAL